MYNKDLCEDLRLRLSKKDMDFLRDLSSERACSLSECIRSLIGEYRRSIEAMRTIMNAVELSKKVQEIESSEKGVGLSHGDTKTNIYD